MVILSWHSLGRWLHCHWVPLRMKCLITTGKVSQVKDWQKTAGSDHRLKPGNQAGEFKISGRRVTVRRRMYFCATEVLRLLFQHRWHIPYVERWDFSVIQNFPDCCHGIRYTSSVKVLVNLTFLVYHNRLLQQVPALLHLFYLFC